MIMISSKSKEYAVYKENSYTDATSERNKRGLFSFYLF